MKKDFRQFKDTSIFDKSQYVALILEGLVQGLSAVHLIPGILQAC